MFFVPKKIIPVIKAISYYTLDDTKNDIPNIEFELLRWVKSEQEKAHWSRRISYVYETIAEAKQALASAKTTSDSILWQHAMDKAIIAEKLKHAYLGDKSLLLISKDFRLLTTVGVLALVFCAYNITNEERCKLGYGMYMIMIGVKLLSVGIAPYLQDDLNLINIVKEAKEIADLGPVHLSHP